MDGIALQKFNQKSEANEKVHTTRLRREKIKNQDEITKTRSKYDENSENLRKEYELRFVQEQNDLENKLKKMHADSQKKLKEEDKRYEDMVSELKKNHEYKLKELNATFETQKNQVEKTHENYLKVSEEKIRKMKSNA